MIASVPQTPEPAALRPPALVAPAPRQASFGRIAGTAGPGTDRIVVSVDGTVKAVRKLHGARFSLTVKLPARDVTVRVVAVDRRGRRAATVVRRVFGLPRAALPTATRAWEERGLARIARSLAHAFHGTASVYVQDLRTGAGAAWGARTSYPAASTLKLAIAIEVLRVQRGIPQPETKRAGQLRRMLVYSDNKAANELLVWLGGSTSGGGGRVTATMQALGLADSVMYGGYALGTSGGPKPIPLRVESYLRFVGKRTTAWDLARLHRGLHLAAGGIGPLVHLPGTFTPSDARTLLYLLAHTADHGKLDRFIHGPGTALPHKAGWITTARHDAGVVYTPDGVFVVAVMTWNGGGVGPSSDVLAGTVARRALDRLRTLRRTEAGDSAASFYHA